MVEWRLWRNYNEKHVKGANVSVNKSVNRIVTGSGVILAGTLIGFLFDINVKRVLISYLSPGDFGIYSFALTVISITGVIATLGCLVMEWQGTLHTSEVEMKITKLMN